jgi:O-antigen ligase
LGALHPETALENVQTYLFEGLVLYLLITNLINTKDELRLATWALLLAGIVIAVPPLMQHVSGAYASDFGGFAQLEKRPEGAELLAGEWKGTIRHAGSIGEKNRFAQVLLMLVPLGFCRFLAERPFAGRAAGAFVAVLAFMGAALAFSRGAAVAFALVVVAAAVLGCLSRKQTCLIFVALVLGALANPEYRARMASLADLRKLASQGGQTYADGALKGRATEMAAAGLVFRDHPIVGVGPGMFRHHAQEYGQRIGIRALERERQSHSLLLDVAAENGILGLICVGAIFWQLTRRLRKTRSTLQATDPAGVQLVNGYLLAMITYFATGLFLHFAYIRYFWLMLALTDSAGALANNVQERRSNLT